MGDGRGPKLALLELTEGERETLRAWARRGKTAQALAVRARIVLASADGLSNSEVSRQLGVSLPTVGKWRGRFVAGRLGGVGGETRQCGPRKITEGPGATGTGEARAAGPCHHAASRVCA